MRIRFHIFQLIILVLISLISGCTWDEMGIDKINGINDWNPEMVIPLGHGEFEVWDLVDYAEKDNTHVTKDSTGLLHIYVSGASLGSISATKMVKLPSKISSGEIPKVIGDVNITDHYTNLQPDTLTLKILSSRKSIPDFAAIDGSTTMFPPFNYTGEEDYPTYSIRTRDYTYMYIKSGKIIIQGYNHLPVPVTFKVQLTDNNHGEESRVVCDFRPITAKAEAPWRDSLEINNIEVSQDLKFEITEFQTKGSTNPVLIDINSGISFITRFKEMTITEGVVNLNNESLKNLNGEINIPISDYKLKILKLKKGLLTVNVESDIDRLNGDVEIKFPSTTIEKDTVKIIVPLKNSKGVNSISLKNVLMDMSGVSDNEFNQLSYQMSIRLNENNDLISFHSTDHIKVKVDLSSPSFKYILGDFRQQKISVTEGIFNDFYDNSSYLTGNIEVLDPRLILTTENSFGIPVKADFQFIGRNKEGESVNLNPQSINPAFPKTPLNGIVLDTFIINKNTSNIVDFANLPPDESVEYSGTIEFNPEGEPTEDCLNWIADTSMCKIHIDTEIPIAFKTSNLEYRDTFKYNINWPDELDNYMINFYSRNEIPLNIDADISILSSDKEVLATPVKSLRLKKGIISEDGVSLKQGENLTQIEMNEANIDAMKNGKYISFSGTFRSKDNGVDVTRIFAEQKLDIRLSVTTKVNITE